MTDETTLPAPIDNGLPAWELDLAVALGYTREPDGDQVPTVWNLPEHPFAFLEDTAEVIVWEIDGPLDEHGLRQPHPDQTGNAIALTARRATIPAGFHLQTITTTDGAQHRIAIRDAA